MNKISSRLKLFSVWSNLIYIIPIVLACRNSLRILGVIFVLLFILSTLFHIYKSKLLSVLDQIVSVLVFIVCVYLIFISNFNFFLLLLICAILTLAFYIRIYRESSNRDSLAHGFWHLCASAAIILSLYEYLNF